MDGSLRALSILQHVTHVKSNDHDDSFSLTPIIALFILLPIDAMKMLSKWRLTNLELSFQNIQDNCSPEYYIG